VALAWAVPSLNTDGTPLTDIAGYRVYYGSSPANLSNSANVPGAGATSFAVGGLAAGIYYFAVATVNASGAESSLSNAASRTVP